MYSYFKCEQYQSAFCKASIKQLNNGQIKVIKEHHTHRLPQNDKKKEFREILKNRDINEIGLLKNIYDEEARK